MFLMVRDLQVFGFVLAVFFFHYHCSAYMYFISPTTPHPSNFRLLSSLSLVLYIKYLVFVNFSPSFAIYLAFSLFAPNYEPSDAIIMQSKDYPVRPRFFPFPFFSHTHHLSPMSISEVERLLPGSSSTSQYGTTDDSAQDDKKHIGVVSAVFIIFNRLIGTGCVFLMIWRRFGLNVICVQDICYSCCYSCF